MEEPQFAVHYTVVVFNILLIAVVVFNIFLVAVVVFNILLVAVVFAVVVAAVIVIAFVGLFLCCKVCDFQAQVQIKIELLST